MHRAGAGKSHVIGITVVVIVLIAIVVTAFKRKYVLPSSGLVGLQAHTENNRVIVSGSILPSGAKITKTTLERNHGAALVRVYVAGIEPTDRPEDCRGAFAVVVPLTEDITAVAAGESSRWLTVGEVFGIPVRIPKWPINHTANRVLWTNAR
jgi:hypothetical protein